MIRRALFGITSMVVMLVALLLAPALHSQTAPASVAPGPPGSDALPFLTALFSRYAHATIYHLEYTEEAELKGEYMHNWRRTERVAVVGPRNQYRFQYRGESGQALQLSDGATEWIYCPGLNQYTQQPAPSDGPSKIRTSASMALQRLNESRSTVHSIARRGDLIQRAIFAPDQDVQIGDQNIPCVVITTQGVRPGSGGQITTTFTFWVEKQSGLIRKFVSRTEGELLGSSPGAPYVSEDEQIYTIATLNPSSFSEGTFAFSPPATAVLVKQFTDKEGQELAKLVGKPLPAVTLKDSAGRDVSLQSFQGKHLFLDFWATWCVPCRESLPSLEKLYAEYKDKGVVLLSLDEDQEPQKAAEFWAKNKVSWQNYHLDKLAAEKFPPHGIPYYVLTDPSGNVVFSQAGTEEEELRAVFASMNASAKTAPAAAH